MKKLTALAFVVAFSGVVFLSKAQNNGSFKGQTGILTDTTKKDQKAKPVATAPTESDSTKSKK
ncbi:hypothetical protein MYP_1122 [Sporocytophaga myxococcoides]|uniref:Uncharacterized protein n=1 Tax=Sporocytophaga myxococcoides TaxID=153721 RepID=A0A098LBV4_9BACT|nr:hypothetical protein [Sporocytophaga myxococcoides]GAL83894.1 hypothetical protein MYP_1122 [Sporocytophaga myxococcoides]